MTTTTTLPFVIGRTYDEDRASDGESRYGAYARDAAAQDSYLWDLDGDSRAREFAAMAWRAATGPVMSPGYVRYHPLISTTKVTRSDWDGTLTASVELMTPPPAALAQMRQWHSWPTELQGGEYVPVAPYDEQITRRSTYSIGYALTTVNLVFALHDLALPEPPSAPDSPAVARTAAVAVGVLVGALNDAVSPVIDAL